MVRIISVADLGDYDGGYYDRDVDGISYEIPSFQKARAGSLPKPPKPRRRVLRVRDVSKIALPTPEPLHTKIGKPAKGILLK